MPQEKPDAEAALRKLGQRLRDGWTRTHHVPDKSLETVRNAVREQWEKEQQTARQMHSRPGPQNSKERKPEEPDQGR